MDTLTNGDYKKSKDTLNWVKYPHYPTVIKFLAQKQLNPSNTQNANHNEDDQT